MSDKDREAMFNAHNVIEKQRDYVVDKYSFEDGWQACDARYAPTLTENEAIDLIQKAMFEEKHTRGYSGTAIDALKAAGVRFKEEA